MYDLLIKKKGKSVMFRKFYINADDIPMCSYQSEDGIRFFAMAAKIPIIINPVEILPGNAGEVTREEFMKVANPLAVVFLERNM